MSHNLLVLALSALIPLVVGSLWYSPLLFAKSWQAATGLTEEKAKSGNMAVSMAVLYVCSFFISTAVMVSVIHQFGFNSMLQDAAGKAGLADANSALHSTVATIWHGYGHAFRTYRHGAFHGAILAMPSLAR